MDAGQLTVGGWPDEPRGSNSARIVSKPESLSTLAQHCQVRGSREPTGIPNRRWVLSCSWLLVAALIPSVQTASTKARKPPGLSRDLACVKTCARSIWKKTLSATIASYRTVG